MKVRTKPGKYTGQFPLLVKRCKELGIDIPTFQPWDVNCIVWRLPPLTESPGGLAIPEDHRSPHVKGVLLAAGPRAMDSLVSNGITLGHYVMFKRFAGWETNDHTPEAMRGNVLLHLTVTDILGSDDVREMLESGKANYVLGDDGRHRLEVKLINGRKEKLLALAAPGSNAAPAERETAAKLAAQIGG